MRTMLRIFVRSLHCCRCRLLFCVLFPMTAVVAVGEVMPPCISSDVPLSYTVSPLCSVADRSVGHESLFLHGSSSVMSSPVMNVGRQSESCVFLRSCGTGHVRLSEIGAASPYTDEPLLSESRRPFRVSENGNIGDPGAMPVGDMPVLLLLLLCGVWIRLHHRKTA